MTGFSRIALAGEGSSSHESEYRSVGPMRVMARYPAQLMCQSNILSRSENSRVSEATFSGRSTLTGEELTGLF